jgi:hypothetical protein
MKTILTSFLLIIFMFFPMLGKTQLVTITGNITSGQSGESLENVSIIESHSNIGTITNRNGFYKLELDPGVIEISYSIDGFMEFSQKMELKNDTTLFVKLAPEVNPKNRNQRNSELQAIAKTGKKNSGKRQSK